MRCACPRDGWSLTVTEAPRIIPDKLSMTYTEAEMWAYYQFAAARQKLAMDENTFWAALCIAIFGLGGLVVLAHYVGWVQTSEIRVVAFTTYAAFTAGVIAYHILTRIHYRQAATRFYGNTGQGQKSWDFSFDDAGFTFKSDTSETRVPWHGVNAFEDRGSTMLIWFEGTQLIFLPARVFRDENSRKNFAAAVANSVKAAKKA